MKMQECEILLAAAIKRAACKGDVNAARRYLDAGDVEGFERVCRGNSALFQVAGVPSVLTDGAVERWYVNGQKREQSNYLNGQLHDECTWWYSDGQIREQSNYVNGSRHGECTWWYANGQVCRQSNYVNGQLRGESTWWYPDGQMREQLNYANGEIHGEYTWWDEDGKVLKQLNFVNGVKQS
jgi:antitoxin component YwqK of YwqJK toxin-antitoxin module